MYEEIEFQETSAPQTFDGDFMLPSTRVSEQVHLYRHLPDRILHAWLVLGSLRADKRLNERVRGLGVQGQGVAQGLQLLALVQESFLQALPAGVEVLLDGVPVPCPTPHTA